MNDTVRLDKKRLLSNSASALAARGLNLVMMIWLQQYLLRRITAAEYAVYPVVLSVTALVFMIRTILTSGVARYVTEAYAQRDVGRIRELTSTMVVLQTAVALALFVVGVITLSATHDFIGVQPEYVGDARLMFLVMVGSFAVQLALMPLEVGLFVTQKFYITNALAVMSTIIRIGLTLGLLLGVSTRVIWVVVATETANMVGVAARVFFSRKSLPELTFSLRAFSWSSARILVGFGGWAFLGRIASRIRTSADPLILNRFATPTDVASFHIGFMFQRQLEDVVLLVTEPIMPGLTGLYATGNWDAIRGIFCRFGRFAIWAILFASVPLMVFNQEFISLYAGPEYLSAGTVLLLIMASEAFTLGIRLTYKLAIASGQVRDIALRAISMQLVNLGITIALVAHFNMGAIGSALGTATVFTLLKPFLEIPFGLRLARLSFGQWWRQTVLPGYAPAVTTAASLVVLRALFLPESWLILGAEVFLGAVIYLSVLLLWAMAPEDRADLRRVGHGITAWLRHATTSR